ncbi:MAG: Hsp20/alpha crystallin family protein [Actinomycetota bacterium]
MRRNGDLLPVRRGLEGEFLPWSESSLFNPPTLFGGSPWQMMRRMQADMDRLFQQLSQPLTQELQQMQQSWAPSVDISHDEKEWLIEAELPGVEKDNIEVEVRQGNLLLRAEVRQELGEPAQGARQQAAGEKQGDGSRQGRGAEAGQERQYHRRERRYGFFERVLPLPENVNEEQIHCEFKDGVLKVHLPKVEGERQQARRIPISGEPPQLTAHGNASEGRHAKEKTGETRGKADSAGSKGEQKTGRTEPGASAS